jgi:hypothetical protein
VIDDALREPRAPKWAADIDHDPNREDIAAWEQYERDYRDWETLVAAARVVDLSKLIGGEFEPPPMLTPRIVAGTTTVVAGERAKGKTWVAAHDAVQVIKAGGSVVWVDLEMGRVRSAERFKILGLTPDEARERLTYFESPMMPGEKDENSWRAFWALVMQTRTPALVVIDAVTEALSIAGLDDWRGIDVARWHAWYANPALLEGAAVVYIDHTPHEKKRAIGSQHKESQAKVVLVVSCPRPFDRTHVGEIKIECTKNTHAAEIPDVQRYRIGQEPLGGRFVFEAVASRTDDGAGDAREDGIAKAKNAIVARMTGRTETDGLTTGELKQLVGMKAATVVAALAELRELDLINASKHGRSIVYWERVPD